MGNTALHTTYAVADTFIGGAGVAKVLKSLSGTKKLIDTENVLIKASGGNKPDVSIILKSIDARLHLGYHAIGATKPFWHVGLGTASQSWLHLPAKPILAGVAAIRGYLSGINSETNNIQTEQVTDNK